MLGRERGEERLRIGVVVAAVRGFHRHLQQKFMAAGSRLGALFAADQSQWGSPPRTASSRIMLLSIS
jgi:hypothetical protein